MWKPYIEKLHRNRSNGGENKENADFVEMEIDPLLVEMKW